MFKNKKLTFFFIAILIFLGFFAVFGSAKAQFGIFDYADALSGLIDIGDPFLSLALWLILIVSMSFVYVLFGAALLQWAIDLPINLNSPVVLSGWTFVQGLVNLFFVLALLFIAIAYILKLESFPVKKILPRLLLVILLVNFSLLVVGMVTDIGEFFMNTLRAAFGVDFIEMALTPLKSSVTSIIIVFANIILAYITASVTIYGAIPLAIAFIIQLITGTLIGSFFQTGLFVIMNLVMGSIFFMYFFLFLGRIVALWLIAIFSPVAFFCLIFPQTKQYFSKWFKALIQWAFMGVVALFLLGLIVTMFNQVFQNQPAVVQIGAMGGMGGFTITDAIYNYLFLIIFLFVALKATQKYIPAGAAEGLAMLKGAGGGMTTRAKSFAKGVSKTKEVQRVGQRMSNVRGGKDYTKEELAKVEGVKGLRGSWARMKIQTRGVVGGGIKRGGERINVASAEATAEEDARRIKKYEGATAEKKAYAMKHGLNAADRKAAYNASIKDGDLDKIAKKGITMDVKLKIAKEQLESNAEGMRKYIRKDVEVAEKAINELEGNKRKDIEDKVKEMERAGKIEQAKIYKKSETDKLNVKMEDMRKKAGLTFSNEDKVKYGTLSNKLAAELKESDFGNLSEDTLKNLMTGEHSKKFFRNVSVGQLSSASREQKGIIRETIKNQVRAYHSDIKNDNKQLYEGLHRSGSVMAGFGITKGEEWNKNDKEVKNGNETAGELKMIVMKDERGEEIKDNEGKSKKIAASEYYKMQIENQEKKSEEKKPFEKPRTFGESLNEFKTRGEVMQEAKRLDKKTQKKLQKDFEKDHKKRIEKYFDNQAKIKKDYYKEHPEKEKKR